MEQTIIDFFAKSSELILHNRLPATQSLDAAINQIANTNLSKFQLNFNQKFNFNGKIPSQWNVQSNRLLVLEFFLRRKSSEEKILVEQWIFELNQVSDSKLKFTIDSQNTLYKKLSILLRSISLLTVTLPLYKSFVADKNSPLCEHYTLEHSINFTRHSLSNWHSSIHEENNYASFSNPDLVLPGRTFSFKVAYPKSLNFLQNIIDRSTFVNQDPLQLRLLKQKLDMNYFGNKKTDRTSSDDFSNGMLSTRKNTADSKNITAQMSSRDQHPVGSEGFSENASPFGSLLTSSPIETQGSPMQTSEKRQRRSSGGYLLGDLARSSTRTRPRFATIDSERSGEYEMYLYEDPEGKFTEVLTGDEVDARTESPRKFSAHPRTNEEENYSQGTSRKFSMHDLKLSINSKPIEKIIEQSDDDKIAELIQVVEELKDHYHSSYPVAENKKKIVNQSTQKGLRFQSLEEIKSEDNKDLPILLPTLASDFELLAKIYSEVKK